MSNIIIMCVRFHISLVTHVLCMLCVLPVGKAMVFVLPHAEIRQEKLLFSFHTFYAKIVVLYICSLTLDYKSIDKISKFSGTF